MSLVQTRIQVQEPYHFIKLNHFTMISLKYIIGIVIIQNCIQKKQVLLYIR